MIQLKAVAKPTELTDEIVQQLTADYKQTDKAVWQKGYIKDALLAMSSNKCCFCECRLGEESKYLEVEHFHPKSLYPNEVLIWENLLPICKRCNGQKSDHDTKKETIIHPVRDKPKEHLSLKSYRFRGKTELGKKTISVTSLNDNSQKIVSIRFDIGNKIIESLEELLELTINYGSKPSTPSKNKIVNKLRVIMQEGTKKSSYSATAATILLNEAEYDEIKKLFKQQKLWTTEFDELEQQVHYCAL
ncbi:MAG: HNH endonuclease [Methyloprofundus sp.]|nr:HNH endonuclease [Methyloprofundus sp.]